jgi:hypothetical protein
VLSESRFLRSSAKHDLDTLIVIQALKLSLVRKLEMWYRPEPRWNTVAREAAKNERVLCLFFHQYLEWLADTTCAFQICPASGEIDHDIKYYNLESMTSKPISLSLTIHTPAFYSRMPGNSSLQRWAPALPFWRHGRAGRKPAGQAGQGARTSTSQSGSWK